MFIMRIALAQMAMSKNIDSNLQKSLDFCDKAKDCDLLFFPEIQLSPFFPQYEKSDVTEYAMNTNSFEIRLYTKCWGKERAYKINLKNFQKK